MNDQTINRVKETAYLPDIVSENLTLQRSGSGYVCRCPFHADKSPSMHLYPPTDGKPYWTYKCYGCGKSGDVIQYVQERDGITFLEAVNVLARRLNIPLGGSTPTATGKTPPRAREAPLRPCYLGIIDAVKARQSAQSDFVRWLLTAFPADDVAKAVERYHLGATVDGHVIFWEIDNGGFVRTGKIMCYGDDGHRIRNGDKDTPDWIHSRFLRACRQGAPWREVFRQLGRADPVQLERWQLSQVFFGLHLLHDAPADKPVAVVESEKTAVIMSMTIPGFIWLASGGYASFGVCLRNSLGALAGRRVLVWPDKAKGGQDFCTGWRKVCDNFPSLNVSVTDQLERTDLAPGEDIADLYLRGITPRPSDAPTRAREATTRIPPREAHQQPREATTRARPRTRKAGRKRISVGEMEEYTPIDWSVDLDRIMHGPPPPPCPF